MRHAIALAVDRQGIQEIYGGEIFGAVADSVIPPDVPGYTAPELGLTPTGNTGEAKKLLEGKTVPPLRMAVNAEATEPRKKQIALIEANLKAAGLDVVIDRRTDEELMDLIDGVDGWDIDPAGGWCFDWPTAASVVLPLMGPNDDGTTWGSSNPAMYLSLIHI